MRRSGPYERTSNQKPTTGIAAEKKEEENRKKKTGYAFCSAVCSMLVCNRLCVTTTHTTYCARARDGQNAFVKRDRRTE